MELAHERGHLQILYIEPLILSIENVCKNILFLSCRSFEAHNKISLISMQSVDLNSPT